MGQLPLRNRHYAKVEELVEEPGPHLLDVIMQKKALACLFYGGNSGSKPVQPCAVSSSHGAIGRIMLILPYYVFKSSEGVLWKKYEQLFMRLPSYTRFLVIAHESVMQLLKDKLAALNILERIEVRAVPDRWRITPWAEDPLIVVHDGDEPVLVEPHSFHRRDDGCVTAYLGDSAGFRRSQTPLYFEGGNTLIGDDFILMGADYAVESLAHVGDYIRHRNEPSAVESVMRMYKEYIDTRRKIIYIGSTVPVPWEGSGLFDHNGVYRKESYYRQNKKGSVQPLFHIDMFITLAGRDEEGRYRLLVGDPALASRVLGEELLPYSMPEVFDDIANGLRAQGFAVYRNPLPLTYVDDESTLTRNWYFATSNNALVEITEKSKTIWMPTYGYGDWEYLRKTDEANKEIWESLGFNVITIEDMHPFAEHSGSLHCIKKVLERK